MSGAARLPDGRGIAVAGEHSSRNAAADVGGWVVRAVRRAGVRRAVRWTMALVAILLLAALLAAPAEAQDVNAMTTQWRAASLAWGGRLLRNAQRLFVLLAGFEVVASAMVLLLKPKRLDDAAGGFVLKILVMSICFFALTSFEMVVPPIYESFIAAGQQATLVPSLNPAQIAGIGIMTAGKILAGAATGLPVINTPFFILGMVVSLLVLLAFAGIACQVAYCLVEGYVVMSAGLFFLGFAGFRGTAALADNYLMYVVHCGIKVFILYLLVPIGNTVALSWPPLSLTPILDLTAPFEMLMGACVFCGLVMFLPGAFASRITSGATLGIAQALRSN